MIKQFEYDSRSRPTRRLSIYVYGLMAHINSRNTAIEQRQ